MRFTKYRVFSKIAETGNMRKAADEMMYTSQALSRIVKTMEEDFGLELLIRGRDGVKLTPDAEKLLPYINSVIEEEDKLYDKIEELQANAGLNKPVHLGACGSIVMKTVNKALAIINKEHPELSVAVHFNANDAVTLKKLNDRKLDFALMVEGCHGDMNYEPLFREEFFAVMHKDHPLAAMDVVSIKELIPYTNVIVADNPYYDEIMANKETHTIVVDEEIMMLQLVEKNSAVAIMSGLSQFDFDENLEVRPLQEKHYRTIGVASCPDATLSPAAQRVIDALKQQV